ncbi:MAG: hypothetical protein KAH01_08240 [Caldisericia bacterium]|nr:hypothetical protein [Caldisericia bacterium]
MKNRKEFAEVEYKKATFLNKVFELDQRGTTFKQEILAGLTTFLILSFSYFQSVTLLSNTLEIHSEYTAGIIAIILLFSAILSILGGLFTKLPVVFGISTGLTVFVTAGAFSQFNMTFSSGFSLILVEGIIFTFIAFTKLPSILIEKTPEYLKKCSSGIIGSFFVLFAFVYAGVISFNGESIYIANTISTPLVFLLVFGTVISITLFTLKTKNSLLISFVLTLLMGMYLNKTVMNSDFVTSSIVLSTYIIGWLILFSIMFDKKVKYALEKSLWMLCLALILGLFLYRNPNALVLIPSKLIGQNGVFAFPSLKEGNVFISSSIKAVPLLMKSLSSFIPALLSLLVFQLIAYVCTFFTIQQFQTKNEMKEEENYFKRGFLFEGIASIFTGISSSASTLSAQGTSINVLSGAKTGLSSVAYGVVSIFGLFIIPLLNFVLIPSAAAPILLSIGILLLHKSLMNIEKLKKEVTIPFLIAVLVSIVTQDIVIAITISLLMYAIIASVEKKRVSTYIWIVSILLVIFEFTRIVIPFFYISM